MGAHRHWAAIVAMIGIGLAPAACEPEFEDDPASQTPPTNAEFLPAEVSADFVMTDVTGSNDGEAAAAAYAGMWVPAPGWNGTVEKITKEESGTALRMYNYNSRLIGGGFWVVAVVPLNDPGADVGSAVSVAGCIKNVEILKGDVGPIYRIVLEKARVIK